MLTATMWTRCSHPRWTPKVLLRIKGFYARVNVIRRAVKRSRFGKLIQDTIARSIATCLNTAHRNSTDRAVLTTSRRDSRIAITKRRHHAAADHRNFAIVARPHHRISRVARRDRSDQRLRTRRGECQFGLVKSNSCTWNLFHRSERSHIFIRPNLTRKSKGSNLLNVVRALGWDASKSSPSRCTCIILLP